MEHPEVGNRCAKPNCGQLDFLPVQCPFCQDSFCQYHYAVDEGHPCPAYHQQQELASKPDLQTKHVTCGASAECQGRVLISADASEKLVIGYHCQRCDKRVCIKHRNSHSCVITEQEEKQREQEERRQQVQMDLKARGFTVRTDASSSTTSSKPAVSTRKKPLNPKIELMKMKMKAVGESSIPDSSRWFLRVWHPVTNQESKAQSTAIFVHKEWSIGKVLDSICNLIKMPNRNHQLPVTDPQRIILFNWETGQSIMNRTEEPIGQVTVSGSSLILEYLARVKNDVLITLDPYQ